MTPARQPEDSGDVDAEGDGVVPVARARRPPRGLGGKAWGEAVAVGDLFSVIGASDLVMPQPENSTAIAQNTEAIGQLAEAMARSMEAIGKLTDAMSAMQDTIMVMQDNMKVMQDGMTLMQASMNNLFERMERFIRGLESDGHKGGKKKRPD